MRRERHGHSRKGSPSREYKTWKSMHQRCSDPASPDFKHYGARGVFVADEWRSFKRFLADMGPRPEGMSLDRFPDKDGPYSPTNCRWATADQQQQNRTNNKLTWPVVESIRLDATGGATQDTLAIKYGVSQGMISRILNNKTWKVINAR